MLRHGRELRLRGRSLRDIDASGRAYSAAESRAAAHGTLIIAEGFSCREQIAQSTRRRAMHLAEVLRIALDQPGATPKRGCIVAGHVQQGPASPGLQAALTAAGAGSLLAGGLWIYRKVAGTSLIRQR